MSDFVHEAAGAVVKYLLVASVIAAGLTVLAWLIIRLGRVRTSVYRHTVWLWCLVGIAVLPPLWLHGPKLSLAVLPAEISPVEPKPSAERVAAPAPMSRVTETVLPPRAVVSEQPALPAAQGVAAVAPAKRPTVTAKTFLAGLWLLGFIVMLARLAVGWHRLGRIRRLATPVTRESRWLARRRPRTRILLSSQINGPVCFGILHPTIILPRELCAGKEKDEMQMILSHELAHVERRDFLTNVFQRLLEAAFFFHPLMWYASRQLTQEREQVCDNWVLARGAAGRDYATFLSELAQRGFDKVRLQGVALSEGGLLGRVRSLLDPRRIQFTTTTRMTAVACALIALIAFVAFGCLRLGERDPYKEMVAKSNKAYSLSRGEDLKHIGPPLVRRSNRAAFYRWNGGLKRSGMGFGKIGIREVLSYIAGIYPQEVEGDKELLASRVLGDFIVREGVRKGKIVRELQDILRRDLKLPVTMTFREVPREVIVARGSFRFTQIPGRRPGWVEIHGERLTEDPSVGGGGGGDFDKFLMSVGSYLNRHVVNEVEVPPKGRVQWHYNHRREGRQNPDLVLRRLTQQTGLTFTKETRRVRVLFVEREGAESGGKSASRGNPQDSVWARTQRSSSEEAMQASLRRVAQADEKYEKASVLYELWIAGVRGEAIEPWLRRLEQVDPDNALPNYIRAYGFLEAGNAQAAKPQIERGLAKKSIRTYDELQLEAAFRDLEAEKSSAIAMRKGDLFHGMDTAGAVAIAECVKFLVEESVEATDPGKAIQLARSALRIAEQYEGQRAVYLTQLLVQFDIREKALARLAELDEGYVQEHRDFNAGKEQTVRFLHETARQPFLGDFQEPAQEWQKAGRSEYQKALGARAEAVLKSKEYRSFLNRYVDLAVAEGELGARRWGAQHVDRAWLALADEIGRMRQEIAKHVPLPTAEPTFEDVSKRMQRIGVALLRYADEHNDNFPARLSELRPYLSEEGPSIFCSLGSGTEITDWDEVDEKSDYVYVPGLKRSDYQAYILHEQDFFRDDRKLFMMADTAVKALSKNELPIHAHAWPRAQVRGIVVDEKGKPVEGAVVNVAGGGKVSGGAKTAANGTFVLDVDKPTVQYVTLVAEADRGARQGLYEFEETEKSTAPSPITIVVKPSLAAQVVVVDGEGKPVSGAEIEFIASYEAVAHGTSDGKGVATVRFPADARVDWIAGLKSGIGFDYFINYESRRLTAKPGDVPDSVKLVLDGAREVRVKALDSAQRPVVGVRFTPWYITKAGKVDDVNLSGGTVATVRTDADGIATFDWIPKELEDNVPFVIRGKRYHCPQSPLLKASGDDVELTARLFRNTRISGKMLLPDEKPAAGILIQAEGRGDTNHYCRTQARTSSDGRYVMRDIYPNQSYIIAVIDEEWAAPSYTGVIMREDQPRDDLDFRLTRGTLIHGRVTVRWDKTPAVGQTITLTQKGVLIPEEFGGGKKESLVRWARTDSEGRYSLRVGPGEYELRASFFEGGVPQSERETLNLGGEKEIVRDFDFGNQTGMPVHITFTAMDVRKVDTTKMRGKVILVHFWATWAGSYDEVMEPIQKAYEKYHDQGLEVIGINTDKDRGVVEKLIREKGIAWPQHFDGKEWDNKFVRLYGITTIPTVWLIDKEGKLADADVDWSDPGPAVDKLLKGLPLSEEVLYPFQRKLTEEEKKAVEEFEKAYALAEGQNVKYMGPPFLDSRLVYYRVKNYDQAQAIPEGPDNWYFRWEDGLRPWGMSFSGSRGSSLPSILDSVAGIYREEVEGDEELLNTVIRGDFIVREGVPAERIIAELETVLRESLKLPLRMTFREVERDVIVAKGTYHFTPVPGRPPDRIELYWDKLGDPKVGGGGSGDFDEFLSWVAGCVKRRVINEVENVPEDDVKWHYTPSDEGSRKPDLLLDHLTMQTGLTFSDETRRVRVLFVERAE